MPSYLDLGVIGVILVSALLSLMRGFTREVLAIASWAAAAAAAYYFYPTVMPYATPYIHKEIVAQAVSAAAVFFVTLIIVSLFTVGCRTRFSTARSARSTARSASCSARRAASCWRSSPSRSSTGWSPRSSSPSGCRTAKTRPALIETADKIIAMLPEDAANTIEGWIKAKNAAAAPAEEPPDEATAPPSVPARDAESAGRAAASPRRAAPTSRSSIR